jgi:hypothetical protein
VGKKIRKAVFQHVVSVFFSYEICSSISLDRTIRKRRVGESGGNLIFPDSIKRELFGPGKGLAHEKAESQISAQRRREDTPASVKV